MVTALSDVNLSIMAGESVAIVGASGSGKSTLLNLLGLMDRPSKGSYRLAGMEVAGLSAASRSSLRNSLVGFVFQQFHLLPSMTALENVRLPLRYRGVGEADSLSAAGALLEAVGLGRRRTHLPAELSGGERQRVAIARALVGQPKLLLADEPTGALDSSTGEVILRLLMSASTASGTTLVVVTHDAGIAQRLPRRLTVQDGRVCELDLTTAAPDTSPRESWQSEGGSLSD